MGGGLERLTNVVEALADLAHRDAVAEPDLAAALDWAYQELFHADFAAFDLDVVKRHARDLIEQNFLLHLALNERIPAWSAQGVMSHRVQAKLRDVFRSARYARDLIGEIAIGHKRLGKDEGTLEAFTGPKSFTHRNPRFSAGPIVLMPGDAILQRGMAHNSAAISRIGDVDSQFSHVAIVARDPKGDGHVLVEALIEDGSVVNPVDPALSHGVGRAVLLRHREPQLAEAAAEMIRTAIARADGSRQPRILYDFTMELSGYSQLYCAKLIRLAYSMATSGDYQIPTFATRLDMKNRDFMDRIGVTAIETFAPGDLELEPEFDIVAEWRDLRVTSELRLKDMIMMKLFEWMEAYDYRFQPSALVKLVGVSGVATARMPGFVQTLTKRFAGKVPPNMSSSAVAAVAMLHWTAEELFTELKDLEARTIASTGRQLHPRLVLDELERMREARGPNIGYLSMPGA